MITIEMILYNQINWIELDFNNSFSLLQSPPPPSLIFFSLGTKQQQQKSSNNQSKKERKEKKFCILRLQEPTFWWLPCDSIKKDLKSKSLNGK
ncbi:hypothetical protein DERP_007192 [Dermatophagoides pteronyssinus]|uniref:Uncharacterized protein n=1 Tax=Dermatophagoides pteronyssinus TaxID=6956 RepID=A0ABQ8JVH9_DERPT|nr:hypothetical protein DERP_007192 [Dermatophagoides pteronyssinus]